MKPDSATIETPQAPGGPKGPPDERVIQVLVNERPVTLLGNKHTGREIKQAAIAQGVAIQPDFVLSVEHGQGQTKIVGDDDEVIVNQNSRFVAIPDDDNS